MATIAILGGTGDLGTGLAIRWSRAGHKIVIGSRTLEKAEAAVTALQEISPRHRSHGKRRGGCRWRNRRADCAVRPSDLDAGRRTRTLRARSSST